MDKRRSVLNVGVSILSRIVLLAVALFVRRLLIKSFGGEVNGLNALYSSIIGMLSVAELGVGGAIVYSMYKPIINGDQQKVVALYCLYRKAYRVIGLVIFAAGLLVMPFLPAMISDYAALEVNVYTTFFLTLLSVALSYLYSAKTSLIEAYKDNYITTSIMTVSRLARSVLQIATILLLKSFEAYLVCQILETLLIWGLTEAVVRRKHGDIIRQRALLEREMKQEVVRNVKAMFMHSIGTVLVMTIDNVIISSFVGVAMLGKYSNYALIAGVVAKTISLFFSPLTSVVGHLCAAGDAEQTERYFNHFYAMNFALGLVFFLGYYAVIDSVVSMFFGPEQGLPRAIAFIIALNQFTNFMRQTALLFRSASGTFYYDRWKPLAEGVANLVLSLVLVSAFSEEYRVVGVIVATIITSMSICHVVEPYTLFRHVFKKPVKGFYLRNYAYMGVFVTCLLATSRVVRPCSNNLSGILVNGGISLAISVPVLGLMSLLDKRFRHEVRSLLGAITRRRVHSG